ncbi:alpha/beta fold hydrolase [Leuconostoc sp. MTCC 10508]|uniref:alpha/beta fold hydrolase n=1 Tax=Leuconostoc sp. MTCC 10508 TaxID=2698683 RepID=UPI0020C0E5E2|nr:alpha/beta hydrolase [Leuconostoc sp. MTCC 10508]
MFKQYVDNEQFNLQINRFINDEFADNPIVQEDLKEIIPQLKDTESWYAAWHNKAKEREEEQQWLIASTYYQAAEFYLQTNDPRNQIVYEKYRETFYKGYTDFEYESYEVPYENSFLPVVKLITPGAKKDLLFFAGFDSYMEEMVKIAHFLKGIDYNIYIFDGPGQGTALRNGLTLVHSWEKPVSAILDYFNIKKASAIGVSLGGYLVMRAAAFEKRLDKVVAFDIFYSFMDSLRIRMPYDQMTKIEQLLDSNQSEIINHQFTSMMAKSLDLNWKINKGFENTGTKTPFELLKAFQKYNMGSIMPLINQDVLLLAGENDQYVPSSRLPEIANGLVNASSVKSVLFDKDSGGDQHCQAGRRELGFNEIKEFLNN